jgi:hypothetical protein
MGPCVRRDDEKWHFRIRKRAANFRPLKTRPISRREKPQRRCRPETNREE